MAILIDMDMPKLCQYCHLWDEEYMACKLHKPNGKCPLREVVMCKDCKHYEGHDVGWCPKLEKGVFEDFFCALGEEDKHE